MHIGDIINNRYKVSEIVGRGALSAVYKAFDMKLCINVAIKETGNSHAPEAMREAEILNECRHQYIPRIIDIVYSDTSVLIIEDYIEINPAIEAITLNKSKHLPQLEVPHEFINQLNIFL